MANKLENVDIVARTIESTTSDRGVELSIIIHAPANVAFFVRTIKKCEFKCKKTIQQAVNQKFVKGVLDSELCNLAKKNLSANQNG